MKVAAELFSERGFGATTMADIADGVGIRSPSLYYHFKDKIDLLEAIANLALDVALTDSKLAVEDDSAPDQKLYKFVHDIVRDICNSSYDLDCLFDPIFYGGQFKGVNDKLRRWFYHLETLIEDGIAASVFEQLPTRVAAYTVRGVVISAIRKNGGYASLAVAKRAEFAARFAVKGLLAEPTR